MCRVRFPLEGGTGAIWKAVARLLPQEKQVIAYLLVHMLCQEAAGICSSISLQALCGIAVDCRPPFECASWQMSRLGPCGSSHSALPVSQKYGEEYMVMSIDKEAKVATLACGQKIQYEALVSTMPLDLTLHWLGQPKWADELSHRSPSCPHPVAMQSAVSCLLIAAQAGGTNLPTLTISAAASPAPFLRPDSFRNCLSYILHNVRCQSRMHPPL